MIVCEEDPLRRDAVDLAKKLKAEGAKILLKDMPKVVHAWDKSAEEGTPGWAVKRDAYEAAVEVLKIAFGAR
jgi:acetyl esterase/lipase